MPVPRECDSSCIDSFWHQTTAMPITPYTGRCGWGQPQHIQVLLQPTQALFSHNIKSSSTASASPPCCCYGRKRFKTFNFPSLVQVFARCFNGCCLACPVEMWKICYKWLGAPLLLMGCSNLVLEQGVSSLNLLTYQMTRFETLEVLEARRKITRELTYLYHAANVVSPPRLLPR